MQQTSTTIIIADDHTLFADGVEQIVQSLPGFEVIAKVTDGKMLLQKLNTVIPDIILMDVNMPYMNGIQATQKILQLYPRIKVIFISMYNNSQIVAQAMTMGAAGFIMKDVTAPVLKEAILNVSNNIPVFLTPAAKNVFAPSPDSNDPYIQQYKLTKRELEIIRLIKEGNATKQIAAILELSVYTVETHRKNINRKLNVQSTAELIAVTHKMSTGGI